MTREPPTALVATDLDGTLLRSDATVSARTRAAIVRAREAGVEVVFATGRPPTLLPDIVAATGLAGVAICANGAMLLDLTTMRPRVVTAFPGAEGLALAAELELAAEARELRVMLTRGGEHLRLVGSGAEFRADIGELVRADWQVFKLAARGPEGVGGLEFLDAARSLLGRRVEATVTAPGTSLVEFAPPGVNKGVALAVYAGLAGVAQAAVHAVGDMPNDVEMLVWAGRGYAVANAHPEVVAAAAEVLPSNDEDGVAVLLERLGRSA